VKSLFETTASTATFSDCRRYRYTLTRTWDWDLPQINFLMLNPSTADDVDNDPTVERCERRARMWNYGGLIVTNLFAFRSTDPAYMKAALDPVGPDNDAAIVAAATDAQLVVCAWGKDGLHLGRGDVIRKRLSMFTPLYCLRISESTQQPWHPLYLPYSLKPTIWRND
jgi:hypothetical protein